MLIYLGISKKIMLDNALLTAQLGRVCLGKKYTSTKYDILPYVANFFLDPHNISGSLL